MPLYLLNRYEVGHDGKTAYERCKGTAAKVLGIEFGDAVLRKRRAGGGALAKGASGEVIVADEKGVWKTRAVQRKPSEATWEAAVVDSVKHVPWRFSQDDPDGEPLTGARMDLRMQGHDVETEARTEPSFQRLQIKKSDFEKLGFTTTCQGCKSILRGTARQGRTEACRSRMEAELTSDPRLITQRKRDESIAKKLEETDGKRWNIKEVAKDDATHDVSSEGAASSAPATAGCEFVFQSRTTEDAARRQAAG